RRRRGPDRPAPHLRARHRRRARRPRRRLHLRPMTTALILLPAGGALLVWLLPWSRFWAGSFALLVALAEVGLWIETLVRFEFSRPGPQLGQRASWFGDLGISYHVGLYSFSLWLIGMSVVVMAVLIAYAFWAGRERP